MFVTDALCIAVDSFIAKSRVPHLLFYGPPGTGKTSTILAVARKLYGDGSVMRNNCLEVILSTLPVLCPQRSECLTRLFAPRDQLNASDDRGIDVVREQIKNFASTRMQGGAGK